LSTCSATVPLADDSLSSLLLSQNFAAAAVVVDVMSSSYSNDAECAFVETRRKDGIRDVHDDDVVVAAAVVVVDDEHVIVDVAVIACRLSSRNRSLDAEQRTRQTRRTDREMVLPEQEHYATVYMHVLYSDLSVFRTPIEEKELKTDDRNKTETNNSKTINKQNQKT
jgi:hypothetical protein